MPMPTALARYHKQKSGRRTRTRTIYKTRTRTLRAATRRRRRSGSGGVGSVNIFHVALATAGLSYAVKNVDAVYSVAAKIPGSKTFGPAAMVGLACLATDKFLVKNRWLKLMGIAGVVLAASQLGTKGTDFEWLGDVNGPEFQNVDGDEDLVGDDDFVGDDE